MKFNIYKYMIILCTLLILLSVKVFAANKTVNMKLIYDNQTYDYSAEEVFVSIDGEQLNNLSMPPVILNGYTLVPAREVFEETGATVEWKDDIEQVFITSGDDVVIIPVNSKNAYVNGKKEEMDTEAKIINNKTMIPLRFVSTAMGYEVNWDNKTRIANIQIPSPIIIQEVTKTEDKDSTNYTYLYKLVSNKGEILAEYPFINDIGCNMYLFQKVNDDGNDYYGVLDKTGNVIIEPKYNYVAGTKYAVNNIVTFQSDNHFDIYDNKGNLKKSIDCPLGYELSYPGYNEKYFKRYDVKSISGSNVVVAEHLGDMVIETMPNQEFFIIRLFSEQKAGEDYYNIIALPNGEFIAIDKKTGLGVFLNADGSLKKKMDKYLNPSSQILYGNKYFITYYARDNNGYFSGSDIYCDIVDYNGNIVCEKVKNKDITINIDTKKIDVKKDNKEIHFNI